jgi:hypothetical protein
MRISRAGRSPPDDRAIEVGSGERALETAASGAGATARFRGIRMGGRLGKRAGLLEGRGVQNLKAGGGESENGAPGPGQ